MEEFKIEPYVGVGKINFGMSKAEIKTLIGNPVIETIGFLGFTEFQYKKFTIRFNKKGMVNEISFLSDVLVMINDIDIFNNPNSIKELTRLEKPLNTLGFKVFFNFGIAVTGFSKNKENKSISVFSKELVKDWKD